MKSWLKTISILLVATMVVTAMGCIDDEDAGTGTIELMPGDAVPAFSVLMNDGKEVTAECLKGKTSLIVFFHTGCKDCRQELPVIERIYREYVGKINVVCISRAEEAADIQSYWTEQSFTLPYSAQADRTVYHLFAKSGVPRIYVVDKELVIRSVFTDDPLASYEQIDAAIKALQ